MDHFQPAPEASANPAVSVGASLRQAREAAGLSLGDVADRLKLSLRQLEAIERDDFEALPGAAFVRGFVRNYARFLELDDAPLMAMLDTRFPSSLSSEPDLGTATDAVTDTAPVVPARRGFALAGLAGGLILLLGVGWWWSQRPAEPESEALQGLQPMLTEQAASPIVAESAVSVPGPAVETDAASVASAPKTALALSAPVPASAPAAASTNAGEALELNLKASAWVSVTDADGKKLVFATLPAGTQRSLAGKPPFKVVIGNAPNVELRYKGQPVDLAARTRGTTAKLELN
ncbi:RodZ domain-containing protein [Gulbenkiania mobilis]|uniref:RodZ domain-containing protein n=1 Tax=Gulbenkiania mobilis TaxID=397457 RepID=UPI0006BBDCA7|nr:RodZ domain-containing protein [Gulbenkiania mobilis]